MSAPHGHAGERRGAALGARPPRARARTHGCAGSVSPEAKAPPVQAISTGGSSASAARTAASNAARAAAGSSPTRTPTRPSNTSRSGTELDHSPACDAADGDADRAARAPRIAGCSTSALIRASCSASAACTAT